MAHLNQKEKELIRLFALGEELSEQDTKKCQDLIDTIEGARDELNKHDKFKVLMTQGKNRAVDSAFVNETMRRISTMSQPPLPSSPTVLSERLRIPAWFSPPAQATRFAFFALIAVLLTGYYFLINPKEIMVPAGEQKTMVLADLTEITISSGSSLKIFPSTFRSQRKVLLKGEAYFNVMPDEKPFIVETFNSIVTVVGTQFNVRAYPNQINQKTEVAVQEGLVEVASTDLPEQAVNLAAGQGTEVYGTESAPSAQKPIVIEHVINWQTGGFTFVDEPLIAVLNELERRFAIKITAPPHLHELKSNYFDNSPRTVDEVLGAICESLDLTYSKEAMGYKVLNKP